MSKLEELVPPWELCKLIPKGEFEDSALIWVQYKYMEESAPRILPREHDIAKFFTNDFLIYPAPTLEEILQELFFISHGFDLVCFWDGGWHVKTNEGEKFSGISPVCGALKLWLELKGIDYEK